MLNPYLHPGRPHSRRDASQQRLLASPQSSDLTSHLRLSSSRTSSLAELQPATPQYYSPSLRTSINTFRYDTSHSSNRAGGVNYVASTSPGERTQYIFEGPVTINNCFLNN